MTAISLPVDLLKAAILCVSNEETRYYLNGVCITTTNNIVSTDGHRLFVGRFNNPDPALAADIIIPLATLKQALTGYKLDEINLDGNRLGNINFEPIDGTFPAWDRVVPHGTGRDCTPANEDDAPGKANFNCAFVGDLGKISKILTGKVDQTCFHIWTASSPAGVTFAGRYDAFAVIMPRRANHGAWTETLYSTAPHIKPQA